MSCTKQILSYPDYTFAFQPPCIVIGQQMVQNAKDPAVVASQLAAYLKDIKLEYQALLFGAAVRRVAGALCCVYVRNCCP